MQDYPSFLGEIKAFKDEVRSWPRDKKQQLLEDFDAMMRYIGSDEFAKIQTEEYIRAAEQAVRNQEHMILIEKAKEQGIITDKEYLVMLNKIMLFGGLCVSPEMAERLAQVKINQAEDVKLPNGFILLHTLDDSWYAWNTTETMLYARISGPYSDEKTARLWCQQQAEILAGLREVL